MIGQYAPQPLPSTDKRHVTKLLEDWKKIPEEALETFHSMVENI